MAGAVKTATSGGALTADMSKCAKARTLQDSSRFSTVSCALAATDAEGDARGFALGFSTEVGNWDLVGSKSRTS